MSDEDERHILFLSNQERLAQMASNTRGKGFPCDKFVVVCIDVDDPTWTELVDLLMPNYDWQSIRKKGEKPVARGTARMEIVDSICQVVPAITSAFKVKLLEEEVYALVMACGGASVYRVQA